MSRWEFSSRNFDWTFLVVTSLWLWRPIGSVISSHSSINNYKRKIVVVERSDDVISDIHKLSKIIWRWSWVELLIKLDPNNISKDFANGQ